MSREPASYTLKILESVREVGADAWDALVHEDSSPFVEHAWLSLLEETGCVGGDTGWMPAHLSLWQDETLVAVAPSYLKGNSEGEFIFDWGWADAAYRMGIEYYPKVLCAVPFTPATGDRVLVGKGQDRAAITRVMGQAAREWCIKVGASGVHVLFPRDDEADAWEQAGYLRRDSVQYHWRRLGNATFDEYLARFDSKDRNQMKRELRRVREAGIEVTTLPPEGHTRDIARAMFEFYGTTVEKHGRWGRFYLSEPFFEALTERFRHRLAWVVARDVASGRPVGGAFNVVKNKTMYGRYWGASVDVPNLHFVICYYAGIRYCLEHGIDTFEGGAGRDEHKRSRGFTPARTRSVHWVAAPRLRNALSAFLAQERARVEEALTEP